MLSTAMSWQKFGRPCLWITCYISSSWTELAERMHFHGFQTISTVWEGRCGPSWAQKINLVFRWRIITTIPRDVRGFWCCFRTLDDQEHRTIPSSHSLVWKIITLIALRDYGPLKDKLKFINSAQVVQRTGKQHCKLRVAKLAVFYISCWIRFQDVIFKFWAI